MAMMSAIVVISLMFGKVSLGAIVTGIGFDLQMFAFDVIEQFAHRFILIVRLGVSELANGTTAH